MLKILKIDKQENFVECVPHNFDDLWVLQQFLQAGDIVFGSSTRAFKPKDSKETVRKKVFVELEVEKAEFQKFSGSLKILGIILSGRPEEYVELKAHHSLEIELNEKLKVRKKELSEFELSLLRKAEKATLQPKLLVIVMDDEEALFAELKGFGFEQKGKVFAQRQGKQFKQESESRFFSEILKKIQDSGLGNIIIAGQGFAIENFRKFLQEKAQEIKAGFEALNSIGITGLNELLKRGLALKALQQTELAKEAGVIEEFLKELGRNSGTAVYGLEEVKNAVKARAVKELLVSQKAFLEKRELIEPLMREAEKANAAVHVFVTESQALEQLDGFGGLAALLRYRLNF